MKRRTRVAAPLPPRSMITAQSGCALDHLEVGGLVVGLEGLTSTAALNAEKTSTGMALSDFDFRKRLGAGSQGQVVLAARKSTKELFAVKITRLFPKEVHNRSGTAEELRRVLLKGHKNVVRAFEAFYRLPELILVLEFMDRGTLKDLTAQKGFIAEPMLSCIAVQALRGLASLHEEGLIHRDIKPDNVLLNSKGEVKLGDLGVCYKCTRSPCETPSVGAELYQSPECVLGLPYDFKRDVWALGLTLAEAAVGSFPVGIPQSADEEGNSLTRSNRPSLFQFQMSIVNGEAAVNFSQLAKQMVDWVVPSNEFQQFTLDAMTYDPQLRPSCTDLLLHPFVTSNTVMEKDLAEWISPPSPAPSPPCKHTSCAVAEQRSR